MSSYDGIYHWTQNQFDALVSFTFNCGAGNFKKLIENGKRSIKAISDAIPRYNKAGGRVLSGLTRRRSEEKALFDRGLNTQEKSLDQIAQEVIDGRWGTGNVRRQRLTSAGYNYVEVQKIVNKMLSK